MIAEDRCKTWPKVDQAWESLPKIPRTSQKGRELQQQLEGEYKAWRAIYVELNQIIEQLTKANGSDQKQALYAEYRKMTGLIGPVSELLTQAKYSNLSVFNSIIEGPY